MKRLFQILAVLALLGALPACRDAGGSDNVVPTSSPTPVPSPTPGMGSSVDDVGDGSTVDDGGTSVVSDSGAAMVSSQEAVTVTAVAALDATTSEVTVQRANGEIWTLDALGAPTPAVGDEALFQSATLVFGDTSGFVIFPSLNSTLHAIADATRIR